jgi:hypothetical protein
MLVHLGEVVLAAFAVGPRTLPGAGLARPRAFGPGFGVFLDALGHANEPTPPGRCA